MSRFAAARVPGDSGGPQTAALAQLRADFPTIDVANGPELRTPETIGLPAGLGFLTGPSTDRVGTMRAFMSTYAGVYGLSADQVAGLELVADYTNPAGNMAWVEFEQKINGLPVFRGLIRGGFTAQGELARTTGSLAPGLDPMSLPVSPVLMAEEAVVRAADSVGWSVPNGSLERQAGGVGGEVRFGRGRAGDDVRAWLLYFPLSNGVARLAWATVIWGDPDVYMMLVDAEDGSLLFRKNLTNYQTQPATYVIYNDDSPAPLSPTTVLPGMGTQAPSIARTLFSLIGNEEPNTFNSLGWMTDGLNATEGNNVRAGLDLFAPDGIEATVTGVDRVFDFAYNPAPGSPAPGESPTATGYRNGEVTDMFYWTNVYHDRLYLLGFTEAARNFQNDNFGRGGLGGDRVRAEGQDYSGTNNANFSTPPDGTSGRMQMYIFPDTNPARTSGLDHDVVIHELTHGTSNRLHSNGSGLSTTMSGGMGEGWSDFYARAVLSSAGEDPNGIYTTGGWVTYQFGGSYTDNYYYGIRRFPYAVRTTVGSNGLPHNPLTFADIDPSQINLSDGAFPRGPFGSGAAFQVHNIGEVWASALFEVRARFITRLGYGVGHQRILQFVTDGMKLDPANPTLLQGRDSIIAAASAGGGTQADFNDIWAGFAARGMGASAQVLNASTGSVVEAFDVPGITITAQPQSQLISSGQTATLTVTAVGTPPIAYQWYAGVSPNTASPIGGATLASYTTPPLFATASYWVRVSNGLGSVNSNTATVTVMVPGQAAYNPSLKAPMCGLAGNSCDSGPVLINGRDSIPGGNEPNQPNTINNSCGDGGSGTYHVDESIDRLRVFTLDGTPFAAGKLVRIEATVWVFNEFPLTDRLDLYRAPDATNPVWTFVATLTPSAAGAQIMTADYVLPAGSLQAVRGNFRFGGGASPCSQGNFDDHDDLIFAVGTVASPFNKIAPLSGAVDQPAGVTVTWQASSGASGYEVCYDTTNNNSCDTGWRPVGTNTSAFLTEVRGGGTYFWQVRAQSAGPPLEANGGTWWSLTLESIGKLGPAFGAGDLPTSVPLSWQSSAGSATYEYCVDTVNNQRCDSAWVPVGGATGAVVPVGAGGTYFWQVRAVSAGGPVELNEGAWWRFSTSGAFSKVGPGSDTSGHPMDVLLSWQASTGATGYEYCVDLTNNGTCDGAWVSAGTNTSALVSGLTAGATYYWQVRALTAGGPVAANSGVWWHFTRQPAPAMLASLAQHRPLVLGTRRRLGDPRTLFPTIA
jgi:hypothetical protein